MPQREISMKLTATFDIEDPKPSDILNTLAIKVYHRSIRKTESVQGDIQNYRSLYL